MSSQFLQLSMMLLVAVASGLVGVFALMKKMTLAADSISHVALPGLGLAILFKINPLIGGVAALLLGVILIWLVENKTQISTETVIGVFFSAALAIGTLITPEEELIDVLFGSSISVDLPILIFGLVISILIIGFIFLFKEKLTLSLISEDLARVAGVNTKYINLSFLIVFVLNVILGLQFLGALLMGSLIIVPAAIARNLAHGLNSALRISVTAAILSIIAGWFIASSYNFMLGPTIISVASVLFFLTLLKK